MLNDPQYETETEIRHNRMTGSEIDQELADERGVEADEARERGDHLDPETDNPFTDFVPLEPIVVPRPPWGSKLIRSIV